jgi:hypothetical protein
MIWKILIWMVGIIGIVYLCGLYPTAALVVMALGITGLFLMFKDVS